MIIYNQCCGVSCIVTSINILLSTHFVGYWVDGETIFASQNARVSGVKLFGYPW